jgi:hypothetical protein
MEAERYSFANSEINRKMKWIYSSHDAKLFELKAFMIHIYLRPKSLELFRKKFKASCMTNMSTCCTSWDATWFGSKCTSVNSIQDNDVKLHVVSIYFGLPHPWNLLKSYKREAQELTWTLYKGAALPTVDFSSCCRKEHILLSKIKSRKEQKPYAEDFGGAVQSRTSENFFNQISWITVSDLWIESKVKRIVWRSKQTHCCCRGTKKVKYLPLVDEAKPTKLCLISLEIAPVLRLSMTSFKDLYDIKTSKYGSSSSS